MANKEIFWTPLDNAAKIFPAIRSKEHTTVMRLTAVLKERIKISCLLKAVKQAEKRFPYFLVSLRRGFFWYYLEQVDESFSVIHDSKIPCRGFDSRTDKSLLLRILVHKNELSIECSHIITDGYGALTFLRTLLIFYFTEKGITQSDEVENVLGLDIDDEEFGDAYNKYFKENIPRNIKQPKAFHLPFQLKRKPRFDLLFAILSIEQIKLKAKDNRVSITDYLVAVYLWVLQDVYFENKKKGVRISDKIARIQVPVNLRNIYPSKTLQNFSLFIMPEIDFRLGEYSFNELLKIVYHRMRLETDEKLISKIISRNVGGERNIIVRGIPIWLKSFVLYVKYYSEGANQYSGVVTNLGKVELPETISNKIDYFIVTPPPPNKKLKINCGVVGYGDKLVLSFGNITRTKDFERRYLQFLAKQGVYIRLTKKRYIL
jgi:NRPS condensation-like uncharacterized protein